MPNRLTVRLAAPFLTISVVLLVMSLATIWAVYRLHATVSEVLKINVPSIRAAPELEIRLRDLRWGLGRFLVYGDNNYLDALPDLRKETDTWLHEVDRFAETEREKADMAKVKAGYKDFFTIVDQYSRREFGGTKQEEARRQLDHVFRNDILVPLHDYLAWNEELAAKATANNQSIVNWTIIVLVLLGIVGPAAGMVAGWAVARRVSRSILRLSVPIQDATGRLSEVAAPVTLRPGWDLEELEIVLKRLAEQVGAVLERLQQSQREALRAEQLAAVGQMAAGFAHELRNPLMSMKILVQSAAERGDRGRLQGRDLAVLEEEILRLEHLTSSLVDFARPPQPDMHLVDVGALIENVVDLVSAKAAQRAIAIECAMPDEPALVEADAAQMRQVLVNLLLNALEAVQEQGTVWLRTDVVAGNGHPQVLIRVADSGPGLPVGLDKDIFTPFVSTKPTGLGLGLSVTKGIVEAHGGTIACANRPNGGAEFTVCLPCHREALVLVPS